MSIVARFRAAAVVLAILTMLTASSAAAQDYKSAYADGIRAVDRGAWADVVVAMRQAIALEPTPSAKKIRVYGNRYAPYLPYYNLGLALAQLGDCTGALEAWRLAEQYGAVNEHSEGQELQRLRQECRAALPKPTPTPTVVPATPTPAGPSPAEILAAARRDAEGALDAAEKEASALRRRRDASSVAQLLRRDRRLAQRIEGAETQLGAARTRVEAGLAAGDPRAVTAAAEAAREARKAFVALAEELAQTEGKLVQQAEEQRQADAAARRRLVDEVNSLLSPAREALATGTELTGGAQQGLRGQRQTLEQVIGRAESAAAQGKSAAELEAAIGELQRATASYRDAVNRALAAESKPVPPTPTARPTVVPEPTRAVPQMVDEPPAEPLQQLRRAGEAFLTGQYEAVLAILDGEVAIEGRGAAVLHLLRAAAEFYLFAEGGRTNQPLLDAAESDVASCRTLDAAVVPDRRFFSPAFVDFFTERSTP